MYHRSEHKYSEMKRPDNEANVTLLVDSMNVDSDGFHEHFVLNS